MSKAMSKELEKEIRNILEGIMNEQPGYRLSASPGERSLRMDSVRYLDDIGALESEREGHARRITAYGREYYEKLTAPRWYWFRRNWFGAIVAAATFAASVGGITVNALD